MVMSQHGEPDLASIDIKLLRLFDLLYSTHSVTRSAELLGQSQPTISVWLSRLRVLFDDPLFVRTPEGMQPTPHADELISVCREALLLLRQLVDTRREFLPETSQRSFRICMTDASHITMLPRLFARLAEIAPQVRLEAVRIDSHTAEQLRSGEADLAFGFLPGLDAGFYQQVLGTQDWVCLISARHPRIKGDLDLQTYCAEGHIAINVATGHLLIDSLLAQAGVERRIMLQVPGFLGLGPIVAQTGLIATLPRSISESIAASDGLRLLPCPVAVPSFEVKLHWHTRYHHDPGNRWLRRLCADMFQQRRGS